MQLSHAGRQSPRYATRQPVGPSAVTLDLLGSYKTPRALEDAEIGEIIERFGAAAKVAQECGFTGVQVHGAHGYLISSFLSPVTNRRTDRWGGGPIERTRYVVEALKRVRARVGDGIALGIRVNGGESREGGYDNMELREMLFHIASQGLLDFVDIDTGHCWGAPSYVPSSYQPHAEFREFGKEIGRAHV